MAKIERVCCEECPIRYYCSFTEVVTPGMDEEYRRADKEDCPLYKLSQDARIKIKE